MTAAPSSRPESSVCLGMKSLYADITLRNITIISPAQVRMTMTP